MRRYWKTYTIKHYGLATVLLDGYITGSSVKENCAANSAQEHPP